MVELLRNYSKPVYQGSRLRRLVEMMDKLADQPVVREPVVLPVPHRLTQRLDAAVIAELVQAYRDGATVAVLRQRYGLSQGGVLRLLRTQGVEMRARGRRPAAES